MIKKITITMALASGLFLAGFKVADKGEKNENCNQRDMLKKSKKALGPYEYDTFDYTPINYTKKEQLREVSIPLFSDEAYAIVITAIGSDGKRLNVEIYNKNKAAKNRELLFSTKDLPEDQTQFVFEPKVSKAIFINYTVPASTTVGESGCFMKVVGYQ